MSLIQIIDLGIDFGGHYILKDINCTIEHNSRIGLIGANGSGKTTLIKLIQKVLRPTLGKVVQAKQCKIAYLEQNPSLNAEHSLLKYIESARGDIRDLKEKMEALSAALAKKEDEALHKELNNTVERMHEIGAFEHENEIKYVLSSLGFGEEVWSRRIGDFSGGEQTRICLAWLLLCPYDLLILDEPTNHLDIAMIRWLENYLCEHTKPYLVVSHDRVFLDKVTRSIYAIENTRLSITKGNYSSYYEARQIAVMAEERQFERQQKLISETTTFIQKNLGSQKTKQAQSRQKMLEKLELVDAPAAQKQFRLRLESTARSGNDVFRLHNASFGIGESLLLAQKVDIEAHWQDRIAVIGPNGCGKSTLLRILLGEYEITKGDFYSGASLKIGYYDQHQNTLDPSLTVMQTLWNLVPAEPKGYVLSWLARFGFIGDDVEKKIPVLSGGEKSRLYLSVLIHERPNLLILDEPTNHLDIPMHDALLQALQDFEGTIIFVSHDRHFIKSLSNKFWVFNRQLLNGRILKTISEPDLAAEAAIELAFSEPELPRKEKPEPRLKKRKINPWHLEQIEKEILSLTNERCENQQRREEIHQSLSESATYSDSTRVRELNEEEKSIEQHLLAIDKQVSTLEHEYLVLACED
ncbi:MAG: ABC-F family ATP-binding cassette domain-containing protein [Candidatus Cloacimonetes bacterium]|jgi:ATP-binding cassette subfamily F protein 3|nr:ABC-F family ATP-binding cassette domain-containing protein [Candidatus Cloacimonadota bacterium]MCB5286628.1 ABC-F family ATP-binding cassette domain-containing protein [Candidatus Cloacimonadota bacterium]MCK9183814.1 ABC-F family ATP-binding cassette domain-containing protein [Candidatus Cloacimonadota bacterium]MCK9584010.1 ABC-F family ATP-binding cassette domain-containing protein [Candidatus Cloacimonadota bacterium]MDY0228948.1 ABC-F family ATP-binding cassette domain-containing prot